MPNNQNSAQENTGTIEDSVKTSAIVGWMYVVNGKVHLEAKQCDELYSENGGVSYVKGTQLCTVQHCEKTLNSERAEHAMDIAMLKAGHARDTVQLVATCDKYDEMESCLREAMEALETCHCDDNAVGADGGQSFDDDKVEAALKRCTALL